MCVHSDALFVSWKERPRSGLYKSQFLTGSTDSVHSLGKDQNSDLQLQPPCHNFEADHVPCNPMLNLQSCVHLQYNKMVNYQLVS